LNERQVPVDGAWRSFFVFPGKEYPMTQEFKSFYKTVGGNEGGKCKYPTRLDTYGCGCAHDCKYCYAKSLLSFRGLWHPEDPHVANLEKIEKTIQRLPKGTILRLGGMTDCFQPCELEHRITLETIKLLNQYGIGYLIVTKSHLVANDEYLNLMDKDLAHIQVTVTTTSDERSLIYEKASVPSKRIDAIERLQAAGFDVSLRLSPFIEGYVDYDILNAVRCNKILVEFLRVNTWIKKWFDIDYSDYTIHQSGYQHMTLEKKLEMLKNIQGFKQISVCEDETEHYLYWKEHFNPNKEDCCNLYNSHLFKNYITKTSSH